MWKHHKLSGHLSRIILSNSGFRKIWEIIREELIIMKHERVARFWRKVIKSYLDYDIKIHNVPPRKVFSDQKIIWQYWGQGLSDELLPDVVKICFNSVDKFKGDYQVIRLTDETLKEYITFPDFVWEKRKHPEFKPVFFSDLLRIALLQAYGGIWLDATVLLTAEISDKLRKMPFFAFQRSELTKGKANWKRLHPYYWNWKAKFRVNMLSSIFIGTKGEPVTLALLHLMMHYWKNEDKISNYFFFQILYDELLKGPYKQYKCETIDDTLPHLLQLRIFDHQTSLDYPEIFALQNIHKLTYFSGSELAELENALKHLESEYSKLPS